MLLTLLFPSCLCSQVDPIVASFSGGAVGVLSSLMIVELNNVSLQEEKKCHYCEGSGEAPCRGPLAALESNLLLRGTRIKFGVLLM